MDRREHFYKLFDENDITVREVSNQMGIKKDSLFRKIWGKYGFSEADCKRLMKILNLSFEEIFIDVPDFKEEELKK